MKSERKTEVQKLKGDYKEAYQNMILYFDASTLTDIEKTEILADVLGICLENQERNIPIQDVFEQGYQAFCEDLVASQLPQLKKAFYINTVCLVSLIIFIFTAFTLFMAYIFPSSRQSIHGSFLNVELKSLLLPFFIILFIGFYVQYKKQKIFKATHQKSKLFPPAFLTYVLYSLIPLGLNTVTVPLSIVYIFMFMLVLCSGFLYLYGRKINSPLLTKKHSDME